MVTVRLGKFLTLMVLAGVVSVALEGCTPTSEQLSGSEPPRNPKGRLVDPVYGVPLPGQYNGF